MAPSGGYLACCGCGGQSQLAASRDAEITEPKAIQSPCFNAEEMEKPAKEPLQLRVEGKQPETGQPMKEDTSLGNEVQTEDLEAVKLEIAADPLRVVFHCPGSSEQIVRFRSRPLGVEFEPNSNPLTVRSVSGQAAAWGIQPGWGVKAVYGTGTKMSDRSSEKLMEDLRQASLTLPYRANKSLEVVFEQGGVRKAVVFSRRPLGLVLGRALPVSVTASTGHAAELGVEVGWTLQSVGGTPVQPSADFNKVAELVLSSSRSLPEVEHGHVLPVVFRDLEGQSRRVVFDEQPLGIRFSWTSLPLKVVTVTPQAEGLGVKEGWTVSSIAGTDVASSPSLDGVMELMKRHVGQLAVKAKPKVDIVFVPDVIRKVVNFTRRPTGIDLGDDPPLTVHRVGSQGEELGVKPGWVVRGFGDQEDISGLDHNAALRLWKQAESSLPTK